LARDAGAMNIVRIKKYFNAIELTQTNKNLAIPAILLAFPLTAAALTNK
jgi:hypothetical protein